MNKQDWEKEFDERFGQFYLKAFNSGKFFHINGTQSNQATIDFEAGKHNMPTASEDIKKFISKVAQESEARGYERGREVGKKQKI